jgi:hypothetical protein
VRIAREIEVERHYRPGLHALGKHVREHAAVLADLDEQVKLAFKRGIQRDERLAFFSAGPNFRVTATHCAGAASGPGVPGSVTAPVTRPSASTDTVTRTSPETHPVPLCSR